MSFVDILPTVNHIYCKSFYKFYFSIQRAFCPLDDVRGLVQFMRHLWYFLRTDFTWHSILLGNQISNNISPTFFVLKCMYICTQTHTCTHIHAHTFRYTHRINFSIGEKSSFWSLSVQLTWWPNIPSPVTGNDII